MPEAIKCRRCSECVGCEHHWMEHFDDKRTPGVMFGCKHCAAAGYECKNCEGTGGIFIAGPEPLDEACAACNGSGIVCIGSMPDGYDETTDDCAEPCAYGSGCETCQPYWDRMVAEGLFCPVRLLWTAAALQEAARY